MTLTGLVLFEWHSLDHIRLSESYKHGPGVPGHVVDPYHMNSISIAPDGNLIVSMRNTSATYKIDRRSGQIIWRLGGKDSSFALPAGTSTAFQHDVIVHAGRRLTVFDNGGAAAFVYGAPIRDWRKLDLPNAKIDLYLNGAYIKSGYGRAAMGHRRSAAPNFTSFKVKPAPGRQQTDCPGTGHSAWAEAPAEWSPGRGSARRSNSRGWRTRRPCRAGGCSS